jgi:hypothetical protein
MTNAKKAANDPRPVEPEMPIVALEATEDERRAAWNEYEAKRKTYLSDLSAWKLRRPVIETAEELRELDDLKEGPFYVDEWDRCIILRSMDRLEYEALDADCRVDGVLDESKMTRETIIRFTVKPKLSSDEPIFKKHPMAIKRIADEVLRRSGVLGEVAAEMAAEFPE